MEPVNSRVEQARNRQDARGLSKEDCLEEGTASRLRIRPVGQDLRALPAGEARRMRGATAGAVVVDSVPSDRN